MMRRTPNAITKGNGGWRSAGLGFLTISAAILTAACASGASGAAPTTQPPPTAQAAPTPSAAPAPTPPPAPAPAAAPAASPAAAAAGGSGGVYTEAQAKRGAAFFNARCSVCHQREDFSGRQFMSTWGGAPASELFMLMSTTMPQDNPASLALQEYADILAYFFSMNGMPAGDRELPGNQDALNSILIAKPAAQ